VKRLDELDRAGKKTKSLPTPDWVAEKFKDLEKIFRNGGPAAADALHDLVGGKIILTEIERAGYHRKFLRGRFVLTFARSARASPRRELMAVAPPLTATTRERKS